VAHFLQVRFNTKYFWIGLDCIHMLMDWIGFGLEKWTLVSTLVYAYLFTH